jgi:hypothetical protein
MSQANSVSDLERAEHLAYEDSKGVKRVSVFNNGVQTNVATEAKQDDIIAGLEGIAGLVTLAYDYINITYTGVNATTVVFKTGGSGGTTVATLTITYDANNNPLTVTKT